MPSKHAVMNRFRDALFDLDSLAPNKAAQAIRQAVSTMLALDVCTEDEFMCLIDLDQKNDWPLIANCLARSIKELILSKRLHPNDIKPWHLCQNYAEKFAAISHMPPWGAAHGAINTILQEVRKLFPASP